jgi:hypothetical protein
MAGSGILRFIVRDATNRDFERAVGMAEVGELVLAA